ncbi:MAG: hypothetical protein NWQ16_00945 [Akkermansiaceae bacterium]|nr:hypothetical protein [Akkermansiaceae bacterium]
MTANFAALKLTGIISVFLGLMFGMMLSSRDFVKQPPFSSPHHPDPDLAFLALLAIYLILTQAIWLIRPERWGMNRNQLRTVWLLAFAIGAIGAPLVAKFAD